MTEIMGRDDILEFDTTDDAEENNLEIIAKREDKCISFLTFEKKVWKPFNFSIM